MLNITYEDDIKIKSKHVAGISRTFHLSIETLSRSPQSRETIPLNYFSRKLRFGNAPVLKELFRRPRLDSFQHTSHIQIMTTDVSASSLSFHPTESKRNLHNPRLLWAYRTGKPISY
jgi:hypothetical protein